MISWPPEVILAIARRRVVLFLGAGVSMPSLAPNGARPPSWGQFLQQGIARCPAPKAELNRLFKNGDYLTCCQIIKYKLGQDWIPFLEEILQLNFAPNELHKAIFRLDASVVLTPNFDKIYENLANAEYQQAQAPENTVKVKKYYDDDIPRVLRGNGRQRLILKIHGCIDTPDKLVFTREDYANIRNAHANFYRAIESLIMTHTFIFIGCGLNDPDLSLVLEQYARSFDATPPHYATVPGKISAEYSNMLQNNYNLRPLSYSPNDNHQELLDSVISLAALVDEKRTELASATSW